MRWGLMGASDIAATRMVPALRRTGQTVTAVLSSDAGHAAVYARDVGVEHADTEIDRFLARDDVDAVYVSSVNERHLAQASAAAAAGKHVLCEKPLATSLDEARGIVEACRGVTLGVNHHLPAAGTHRRMRELVHGGAIGRPLAVAVTHATLLPERLRGWRLSDDPGAGAIMDLACHDASVITPLLGADPLDVAALAVRQGPFDARSEDAAMAVLRYPDDVLVRLHDAFTSPFTPTTFEVHGDEGSLRAVDVMTPEPVGTVHLTDRRGTREIEVADRRHTYDVTLEAFTAGTPVVDGRDGARALAVALAVREAATSGRSVRPEMV
jgi:1,5-anhydro-D-fructose reductase (1,5-anhydro-D-mannitol-forming)